MIAYAGQVSLSSRLDGEKEGDWREGKTDRHRDRKRERGREVGEAKWSTEYCAAISTQTFN